MKQTLDVGILTWHYYTNVGSNLQAYALYKVIDSLGYSCEFINYRKDESESLVRKICKNLCSLIDLNTQGVVPARLRVQAYRFQKDYFKQSILLKKNQLRDYCAHYKMLLCGSDQIWAPNVLDETYLLDFTDGSDDLFKCSYASSIGLSYIPKNLINVYRMYLSKFDYVTVRERQGAELLEKILDHKVDWVLDPTLLLDSVEWRKVARYYQIPTKPFLFCYLLGNTEVHRDWINQLAIRYNLNVLCMSDRNLEKRRNWKYLKYVGPREFLGYLDKAAFVVTDSFHGMALSINMRKNFYVLERFNDDDVICQNSRIYNLIEALGLDDQLMKAKKTMFTPIDWKKVDDKLQVERKRSIEILKKMLRRGCRK